MVVQVPFEFNQFGNPVGSFSIDFSIYFGFMAHQYKFTHFEPSQSLSGAKMGEPRERKP